MLQQQPEPEVVELGGVGAAGVGAKQQQPVVTRSMFWQQGVWSSMEH